MIGSGGKSFGTFRLADNSPSGFGLADPILSDAANDHPANG